MIVPFLLGAYLCGVAFNYLDLVAHFSTEDEPKWKVWAVSLGLAAIWPALMVGVLIKKISEEVFGG